MPAFQEVRQIHCGVCGSECCGDWPGPTGCSLRAVRIHVQPDTKLLYVVWCMGWRGFASFWHCNGALDFFYITYPLFYPFL